MKNGIDEIETLTKRFWDYIDKVQALCSEGDSGKQLNKQHESVAEKLYTVVTPQDSMIEDLHAVLEAIDNAIKNIDRNSGGDGPTKRRGSSDKDPAKDVYISSPKNNVFSQEELEFLMETFNTLVKKKKQTLSTSKPEDKLSSS